MTTRAIPRLATHIPGFDVIAHGGLPAESVTLLGGSPGSGKTESFSLEDHLARLKDEERRFGPRLMILDSLSALERVASRRGFREFVVALTSFVKERQITGLFTLATTHLVGMSSVTEGHISSIADSTFLLRYVELLGEMRRGVTVLKMRGSQHDKEIREFTIDGEGMHLGEPFRNVTGILSGQPIHLHLAGNDRDGAH